MGTHQKHYVDNDPIKVARRLLEHDQCAVGYRSGSWLLFEVAVTFGGVV